MNEQVAIVLKKIIIENGINLCNNRIKLQGLLLDLCGDNRKEINILSIVLQQNIVHEILSTSGTKIDEVTYRRLVNKLCDEVGIIRENSMWAVKVWIEALGKSINLKSAFSAENKNLNSINIDSKSMPQLEKKEQSIDEISKKCDKAKSKFNTLEKRKRNMISTLNVHKSNLWEGVKVESERRLRQLIEHIPNWIDEIEFENKILIAINNVSTKGKIEVIVNEISEKLQERINEEQKYWEKNVLLPIVHRRISRIKDTAEIGTAVFYVILDESRVKNTGRKELSKLERLLSAAIVPFIMDVDLVVVEGLYRGDNKNIDLAELVCNMKTSEVVENVGRRINLDIIITISCIACLIPINLITEMASPFQIGLRVSDLPKKIKDTIAKKIVLKMEGEIYSNAERAANKTLDAINEFLKLVETGMENEINILRNPQ